MEAVSKTGTLETATVALVALVDAHGKIGHALAARRLLAKGNINNTTILAKLKKDALTDEELEKIAQDAFEQGVLECADLKVPGTTVFHCNPDETDR